MSRKALFGNLIPKEAGGSVPALAGDAPAPTPIVSRLRARPILGSPDLVSDAQARPVGAIGQSLSEVSERARRAEEIERRLTEGQVIVELDAGSIDPSFAADRMPAPPEALASLTEKIRDHGQLNPILVRPHPDDPARYQVAFGHRRLRALKALGRPVKAVVRPLSDEELIIAQGQENHERQDLSFIEKALFAERLEKRGFSRTTIMAAMSIYKSDLSNMLSVAAKIPADIVQAIGPAPVIGRRGWIELAGLLVNAKALAAARKASQAADFQESESDQRFRRVLNALKAKAAPRQVEDWSGQDGRALAKVAQDGERVLLTIDRRKAPDFADFVLGRLRDLYLEFEASAKERP